jgi:hypothetical protein
MPKMFEIGINVLRESTRTLDRDNNKAYITLVFEPKLGEQISYQRDNILQKFMLLVEDSNTWLSIKDTGPDPLIEMIDAEVQRYRTEKEAFVNSEGIPAPYPQIFPEVIEFLADKDYTVITLE